MSVLTLEPITLVEARDALTQALRGLDGAMALLAASHQPISPQHLFFLLNPLVEQIEEVAGDLASICEQEKPDA